MRDDEASAGTNERATAPSTWVAEADLPPAEVTDELFMAWRATRRGVSHPERQTNPVWRWLARAPAVSAYGARRHFGLDDPLAGEGWTNQRFGQSVTVLADGRTVAIAGEHEDYYDPDFYIYNDVIVTAADGTVEIYGYPTAVFPPTDFHSATAVGDRIIVVGSLGYSGQRGRTTPVFALDASTLTFAPLVARGDDPGWLFRHSAELSADERVIIVCGGEREIDVDGKPALRENPDSFALDLAACAWTRLTALPWSSWDLSPAPGHRSRLYLIGWMAGVAAQRDAWERDQYAQHRAELGRVPDLALYAARYRPPCPHDVVPAVPDEYNVTRVLIDGVVVRYVEKSGSVRVTIEGELPAAVVDQLVEDVRRKLSDLDAVPYLATPLG